MSCDRNPETCMERCIECIRESGEHTLLDHGEFTDEVKHLQRLSLASSRSSYSARAGQPAVTPPDGGLKSAWVRARAFLGELAIFGFVLLIFATAFLGNWLGLYLAGNIR